MILPNAKRRKTNLHVAWIDNKKAFDSLPYSWIAKSLQMLGNSDNNQTVSKGNNEFVEHVAESKWSNT